MNAPGNFIWPLLFTVLIALNVYNIYTKNNLALELEKTIYTLESSRHINEGMVENIITREIQQFNNEGKPLNNDLVLTNGLENNVAYRLNEILSDRYTFILHLPNLDCITCSEYDIEFVENFANKVGSEKILIISKYRNQNDVDVFKRLNFLELDVYNKKDEKLGLSLEDNNKPFMFLASSSDLTARYLFVPDQEIPELTVQYLELIQQKF